MGDPNRETGAPTSPRVDRARRGPGQGALPRPRKILVALLSAAVLAGPFAPTGDAAPSGVPFCDVPGQITPHPVAWYTIKTPRFPSGPQLAMDFAVEPLAPQRIYVTNGIVVMRTADSGCHWEESYSLASGTEFDEANSRILEIEVSAPGHVYLPIQQDSPVIKPHVVMTEDAGATWTTRDGPLLNSIVGTMNDFDASLGNRSAAAMLIDLEYSEGGLLTAEASQALLTTSTAGSVWEPRHAIENDTVVGAAGSGGTLSTGAEELQHVAMNPFRPNEVWVYGDGGVFVSDGVNLNPVDLGRLSVLDISFDGSAVFGYGKDQPSGNVSLDGGVSFTGFPMASVVDSADVVFGAPAPGAVLSSFGRVYSQRLTPGQANPLTQDLSPLDGRAISDVQFGVKNSIFTDPMVFGHSAQGIEVKYFPIGVEVHEEVQSDLDPPVVNVEEKYLAPAFKRVVMRPGQSRTIPYALGLPAAVTPLDVYFMIDISGSMSGTINGIRGAMQDIVDELAGRDIDVNFGVGAFRAFNDPPAYDRVQDITFPGRAVSDALNSLRASGGGAETQMAALLESVTGAGRSGIPPNLDMTFRPGSLRVAIEVTDEPISQGGGHPAYTEVIGALVEHDVKQVGLAIQEPPLLSEPDYDNPGEPAGTLQKVATGSKAVAPPGGVDCDGDGDTEIDEGAPLVCLVAPSRADDAALMAHAIVNVLKAIQDVQDLTVAVSPAVGVEGPSRVVESFEPAVFPSVDLKEPSAHGFDVTVRCPHVGRKTRYPLSVTVSRRGGALGAASLTVVCIPRHEEPVPILPVFTPIAAILPPLPRPPDPIPEPNPNPQPNPQQNPQAGFAAQEQQQPQVALAQAEGPELPVEEESASDEYFATARHHESGIPPLAFIFAAAGITSAYAYVALSRPQTRTAHAGNRRRRRRSH